MKYFVVSEKELVEAVEHFEDSDYCSIAYIERLVNEKQPVEILAEGEVYIKCPHTFIQGNSIDKVLKNYNDKKVKLLIEVSK